MRKRRGASPFSSSSVGVDAVSNRNASASPPRRNEAPPATVTESPAHEKSISQSRYWYLRVRVTYVATALISIATICFVSYGFILRSPFHHGKECDMTYSRFKFLPLEVTYNRTASSDSDSSDGRASAEASARPYRLLKFVDARDPRNVHLWQQNQDAEKSDGGETRVHTLSDNWCLLRQSNYTSSMGISGKAPYPNPGHPVLFIPGHWGEYTQARSLGAHGTQFTRRGHTRQYQREVERGMKDGTLNGHASERAGNDSGSDGGGIDSFIYDVYTADFDGEGAGLHGSRLVRQAHFVAKSIMTIALACGDTSSDVLEGGITIVAHSVGGIVARAVPLLYPETRRYIRTIITLATPHSAFPYAFDSTVQQFYRYIQQKEAETMAAEDENECNAALIVSISAGLRDELIPPHSCNLGRSNGFSGLAADLMPPCTAEGLSERVDVSLGMDHKAISWCHNVLSAVRRIMYASAASASAPDKDVASRVMRMPQDIHLETGTGYTEAVRRKEALMMHSCGYFKTLAIQATMPYRLWEFVALYFISSCIETGLALMTKQRDILVSCRFLIVLPLPLACMFVSIFPLEWATFASTTVLAYAACLLYAAILYGIIPCISWLWSWLRDRKRKHAEHFDNVGRDGQPFLVLLLSSVSVISSASFMFLYHLAKRDEVVFNWKSAIAVIFWSLVVFTSGVLLSLAAHTDDRRFRPGQKVKTDEISMASTPGDRSKPQSTLSPLRMVAAVLGPTIPFAVAGKVAYALSLVSTGGQKDDEVFAAWESEQWEGRGLLYLFQHDLVRCVAVLFVLNTVLLKFRSSS